jgi:hypothetical protein
LYAEEFITKALLLSMVKINFLFEMKTVRKDPLLGVGKPKDPPRVGRSNGRKGPPRVGRPNGRKGSPRVGRPNGRKGPPHVLGYLMEGKALHV